MSEIVLASWRDGKAKDAILDFVERVTTPGTDFIAPADRIAAFDNDGTLWVEQPLPPQFDFVFGRWASAGGRRRSNRIRRWPASSPTMRSSNGTRRSSGASRPRNPRSFPRC